MITELRIGNFKAFGETQRVPIKPITLIFGANSSGKSSILHALLYFQHAESKSEFRLHADGVFNTTWTASAPSLDIHQTKLGGSLVDLGGFAAFVHKRIHTEYVSLGIDFDLKHPLAKDVLELVRTGDWGPKENVLARNNSLGVNMKIGYAPLKGTVLWPKFEGDARVMVEKTLDDFCLTARRLAVQECEVQVDSTWALRFERFGDAYMGLAPANPEHAWVAERLMREDGDLTKSDQAAEVMAVAPFLPEWISHKPGVFHFGRRDDADEALASLCSDLRALTSEFCQKISYLGGMRILPPRHLPSADTNDANWASSGMEAWHRLLDDAGLVEAVNTWLADPAKLSSPYRLVVKELVDAASLEKQFDLLSASAVGGGEQTVFKAALQHSLRSGEHREVGLWDMRNSTAVSHRDVGLGISQILPVLVNALSAKSEMVCIEQPELHLHPALQAQLGDVFIESALGERKNTFLLETHSEHLILRIMRRIRETTKGALPPGIPAIRPDDVAVLFVEATPNGSVVREMKLNERGEFVKAWPGGFFEEGAREILT